MCVCVPRACVRACVFCMITLEHLSIYTYLFFWITFSISMYIMSVCLFSALSRRIGALQISIIIIIIKSRNEKGRVVRRVAGRCPQSHSHKMISTNHFFVLVVVAVVLIAETKTRTELVRLQAYRFTAMPNRFMCYYRYKVGIYKSHSSGAV